MLPSASVSRAPCPETINRGVPPTAWNARTGEFTPPGVTVRARSNSAWEIAAVTAPSLTALNLGLAVAGADGQHELAQRVDDQQRRDQSEQDRQAHPI